MISSPISSHLNFVPPIAIGYFMYTLPASQSLSEHVCDTLEICTSGLKVHETAKQ